MRSRCVSFISAAFDEAQRIAFAWDEAEENEGIILKTLSFAQPAEHHDAIVHQLLIAVVELVVKAVVCPAAVIFSPCSTITA